MIAWLQKADQSQAGGWVNAALAASLFVAAIAAIILLVVPLRVRSSGQGDVRTPVVMYVFGAAAMLCTVVAGLWVALAPSYPGGKNLLQDEGMGKLAVVLAPIAITLLPLMARALSVRTALAAVAGLLLGAFGILASFTIGLFYGPPALLMTMAAFFGALRRYRASQG